MRAAVLLDGATELAIIEIEHDEPRGREVLLRTLAVGLCHSDLHYLDGTLHRPRPVLVGHEAVGVVEAIGPEVTSVAPGDRVVTCLVAGCGECARCRAGEPTRCIRPEMSRRPADAPPRLRLRDGTPIGTMSGIGALAERCLVDERATVPVPATIPPTRAAILGCAVVTGLGAVLNVAAVRPGESVAVIGCGGVGLNVVQGARIAGASHIVAIDVHPAKLELARRLGATDAVDASAADPGKAVRQLTGDGVDHAFEVVGRQAPVLQALEMAAPGRRAYVLGVLADDAMLMFPAVAMRRGKSLVGVFMGGTQPHVDIPRYVHSWEAGRLDLDAMVSRVLTLDEVNDGFAALARGELARAVVSFAGS
jgi:S-(hydroxymethyl)glutathione dehydrogenase/alcohol dehydrogenase